MSPRVYSTNQRRKNVLQNEQIQEILNQNFYVGVLSLIDFDGVRYEKLDSTEISAITVVFCDCEIPEFKPLEPRQEFKVISMRFEKCTCKDFYFEAFSLDSIFFVDSLISNFVAMDGCKFNTLSFSDETKVDSITFCNKSVAERLEFQNGCKIQNIRIEEESEVNFFVINGKSSIESIRCSRESNTGNLQINNDSEVKNVKFEGGCKIGEMNLFNGRINNLTIEVNCNFNSICLNTWSEIGSFDLKDSSIAKIFSVTEFSEIGSLEVKNSIVHNLEIEKKSYVSLLKITFSKIHTLKLLNSIFEKILLQKVEDVSDFQIESGYIHEISLEGCQVETARFKSEFAYLKCQNSKFSYLDITDCQVHSLNCGGMISGVFSIKDTYLNSVDFSEVNILSNSYFLFTRCKMFRMQFMSCNVIGAFILKELKPLNWPVRKDFDAILKRFGANRYSNQIIDSSLNGKLKIRTNFWAKELDKFHDRLIKSTPKATFAIINSSLGKSEFIQCSIRGFQFRYYNGRILECFITGSEMPFAEQIVVHNGLMEISKSEKEYYGQRLLYFNQLKRLFETLGDSVSAGSNHALAMFEQHRLLDYERREAINRDPIPLKRLGSYFSYRIYRDTWTSRGRTHFFYYLYYKQLFQDILQSKNILAKRFKNRCDILAFFLNRISNGHGENWLRAGFFVFCNTVFFYLAYNAASMTNGELGSPFDCQNWSFLKDGLLSAWINKKQIFELLNPVHRYDFMGPKFITNFGTASFDFLSRITISYGIYQFVVAFRRHGKRIT
jgi:hypothetical protein